MKFCYVDESEAGNSPPVQVMVGIIADAWRVGKTRKEFREIFSHIERQYPESLQELKGSKILYQKGAWRGVDPEQCKEVFREFGRWVGARRHHLAVSAIDTQTYSNRLGHFPAALRDRWVAGATHIALQLQKIHKNDGSKGQTVLVFDENKQKADKLNEVLFDPPAWTDSYYGRNTGDEAFGQIVDTAFFTKSHHAGLAQVADIFSFVFRRYSELNDYGLRPQYRDEPNDLAEFVELISPRLVEQRHRWPKRPRDACTKSFAELVPTSLQSL